MAIVIDRKPDIHVSEEEFNRYSQEYQKAFTHYAGVIPTLEEFIRRRKSSKKFAQEEN